MRTCVIFNPTAKGNKARHFRVQLDAIAARAALRPTACAGEARRLAAEAVREGFEVIVAAGGDGTVNEALNGLADVSDGFARTRLGVLPLGTVNVLARELGLPLRIAEAWQVILRGQERRLDLPWVEWPAGTGKERRYFVQLAGAGLDARAVEGVSWALKQKTGPLAYIVAGLKALAQPAPRITVSDGQVNRVGELVLIGNGRFYGGDYVVFPEARADDGLLDVKVFPKAGWSTLLRTGPVLLTRKRLPAGVCQSFRTGHFTLTSESEVPFQLDGELAGRLPATFGLQPATLRLCVP